MKSVALSFLYKFYVYKILSLVQISGENGRSNRRTSLQSQHLADSIHQPDRAQRHRAICLIVTGDDAALSSRRSPDWIRTRARLPTWS